MKKGLFIFVTGLIVGFLMPSCSKDDESESSSIMETFYAESVNLNAVSQDSLMSFKSKIDNYVNVNPQAIENYRYPQIKENIKAASMKYNITINDEWEGVSYIDY